MNEIKRYDSGLGMEERADGEYVLYSDHAAEIDRLGADLEGYILASSAEAAEVDRRGEEIKQLRAELEKVHGYEVAPLVAKVAELSAEVDSLRVDASRFRFLYKIGHVYGLSLELQKKDWISSHNGGSIISVVDEAIAAMKEQAE